MNLDLAIQNTLKRNPMESAMHGVMSNFGGSYQLTAYTESAKAADAILGVPVARMTPNIMSRPVIETKAAEVYTAAPPAQNVSANIDGFDVMYNAQTQNWTVSEIGPAPGWIASIFGARPRVKILITKYGTNSSHRFLSAVESSNLAATTKNKIASFVMMSMDSSSVQTYQQGFTVDTKPDDDTITMSSGKKVIEAPTMDNSSIEMNLAESYAGVTKQKNDTFMGDTVIPQPLSAAQIGMVRTPLGDPVGVHIAPPTRHMGTIRTNRSL
jgi:hypothetical protein